VPSESYDFVCGDVFDFLAGMKLGSFDTILCLGFLYHTARYEEMLRHTRRLKPEHLILDTELDSRMRARVEDIRNSPSFEKANELLTADGHSLSEFLDFCEGRSYMWIGQEDTGPEWMSTDEIGLVAHPSQTCLRLMLKAYFKEIRVLDWRGAGVESWSSLERYRDGTRQSYLITV
jgi:2-polyprenyl-3-methyl-5-hydroxy-6-metoxy-1,4-benzoquinol methylase